MNTHFYRDIYVFRCPLLPFDIKKKLAQSKVYAIKETKYTCMHNISNINIFIVSSHENCFLHKHVPVTLTISIKISIS